eukprot:736740-Pyramimonas_sp.AAC.1
MAELDSELPTHFIIDDQRLTQLDRVFISTPPWVLIQWSIAATVAYPPEEMFAEGIPDHSPVQKSFAPRGLMPEEDQPVPAFICKQPEF